MTRDAGTERGAHDDAGTHDGDPRNENTRPRKIILDCDPGHDDAVALLLAQAHPAIELLAVTTVAGNQSLPKVTHNALGIATLAGITAPIAAGAAGPLVREASYAGEIHGESGLDGATLPPASVTLDPRHAVDLIVDLVMAHEPGEITLVPTGPLTNIALVVQREPRIVERVREVVLMGGAARTGNRTPVAEFNIWFDPDAADIVFSAGWPVTMAGLDITHQARATAEVRSRLTAGDGPVARFTGELLAEFGRRYRNVVGFDAPPVHDPVAVAIVIDQEEQVRRAQGRQAQGSQAQGSQAQRSHALASNALGSQAQGSRAQASQHQHTGHIRIVRAPIAIETAGRLTTGMTVVDLRPGTPRDVLTAVALELDTAWFWDLVADAVTALDAPQSGR